MTEPEYKLCDGVDCPICGEDDEEAWERFADYVRARIPQDQFTADESI